MLVYDNIAFLIRHNNIPIGKAERDLGVSTGYFSRAKKECVGISAELLYKTSRYFGVTMDELYTGSFRAQAIKDELERLRKELAEIEGAR
jgi:hypothetical protein